MIRIDIIGLPAPQGSKKHVGHGVMVESSKQLKPWRSAIIDAARVEAEQLAQPIAEPVTIRIEFRFPLPKTDPYRTRHTTKPDIDKLIRSTLDALVLVRVLKDDSYVWAVEAHKVYARNTQTIGATVLIARNGAVEAGDRENHKTDAALARKQRKGTLA